MKEHEKATSDKRHLSQSAIYWANKAFNETTLTRSHFAELLSQNHNLDSFFDKITRLMPIENGIRIEQKNLKKIQRYLSWETPIPADVIKPWAECLPTPYRQYMKNEIADYFSPQKIDRSQLLECIKEMSEGVTALATGDDEAIRKELTEARDAIDAVLGGKS